MQEENLRQKMEQEVSVKFRRLDRLLKRTIERKVKDTGVYRSQHRILMHLNRQPNCSQVEIADFLDISPAAVAVSLKKLEKSGYICRETDENDNRIHQVTITPKGRQVIEKSFVIFREVDIQMFAGFSDEELKQLDHFLERIARNLGTTKEGGEK